MTAARDVRVEERARRELERQQRKAEQVAHRAQVQEAKRREEAEGTRRRDEEAAKVAAEEVARQAQAAKAFDHYIRVREQVRRMRDAAHAPALSAAEQQMVARLAHMWDAPRETVARLRHACEPVTGVRPADYERPSDDLVHRVKRDYRVLRRQAGSDLFVSESPLLGGFGYPRGSDLVNEDTLACFAALVALRDAAVLGAFRAPARRPVVWEIGGGWGGFAFQFKTLFPNVTYIITGLPEVLLLSAVYLMTAFPHARVCFLDAASADAFPDGEDADFVFAVEGALPHLRPARVDLTLDFRALQQMTAGRVRAHVRRAFDLGALYFYSLLPTAAPRDDVARVWGSIEALYWPHPVPPRGESTAAAGEDAVPRDVAYAHLVGWKRLT